jgi:chromosome segregation protein
MELGRREREGLEESNTGRGEELTQLSQQRFVAEREAEQARSELQTMDDSLADEVAAIQQAEAAVATASESQRTIEREREAANEVLVGVLTSIARTEDRLAGLEDRRAEVDQKLRSADRELEVHQSAVAEAGEARGTLEAGLRNLLAERDRFQEQLLRAIKQQEQAVEAVRQAGVRLVEARGRFETRRARQGSLREVIEAREDVADGTRHLLARGQETAARFGLRGMLRDHLEVERGLELAVEAILSERAEAIVTDSLQGAVDALTAVREESAGRAVFIVEPPAEPASAGIVPLGEPLLTHVRPQPGFEGVARALLAGVYLVRSLREVMEIYGAGRLPAIFVTRQGDVLSPDGTVQGGGSGQTSTGALARLREVRELDAEVEGLERACLDADGVHRAAEAALATAGEELDNLRNRHHTAALAVANHEKDLERTNERVKTLGDAQEGRVAERSGLLEQSGLLVSEREQHAQEIERLRSARIDAQREQDALGLKISAAGRDATRLGSRATELRVAHETRVETRGRLQESAARAETSLRETAGWIERREREIVAATERIAALGEQIAEAEHALTGKLEAEEAARLASEQLRERYEADAQAVRDLDQQLRDARILLNATRDELAGADLAVRESELRLRHQADGVREKWGVDLATWTPPSLDDLSPELAAQHEPREAADDEVAAVGGVDASVDGTAAEGPNDSANALRDLRRNAELAREPRSVRERELERLRGSIQSLGDVNLGAIEEHEELAERFRFLSEQKADLDATIQSLREAIARINRTSRRRFRETFEMVSKRFSENFPRLFGGGKASLSLTESEDVLEAGIDIQAMPPGKRLQNVNLLSGGEKTMTALALLVAVFQVRPSPFFLLDEVDAALDDANVGRFNQLITELAVQSQFLIITHNKRTIEVADVLYGVTMEQKGVSKLVAVSLH